ncbi:MAG: ACP S-malonyltransferase [Sedimentisphaerales bacterium]|nr:ACP S-malonyltransferase [Sedimentisphaerales bacterium]
MKTLFMFPGQGAQQVGMGRTLAGHPQIADLYRQANEIVGYDLARLCFEGPAEQLDSTEFSQPAIFVTSAACLAALRLGLLDEESAAVTADACAGLSLGEYTALYAAEALSFADGLKLVRLRGRSMQQAADARPGAMVSILGLTPNTVQELCDAVLAESPSEAAGAAPMLVPVNFNCPGQIVLSGTENACRRAAELAEEYGAMRAIPLRVAGAFHTKMMLPAAETLAQALAATPLSPLRCPVYANVDGQPYGQTADIPDKLIRQLVNPVRWQQTIETLLDEGFERFIEIGPGRVLTGLVKKTARPRQENITLSSIGG